MLAAWLNTMRRLSLSLISIAIIGCGAAAPEPRTAEALVAPTIVDRSVPGAARVDATGAGMGVSGLRGTLSPHEARNALLPRWSELTRCFARGSMGFEHLGGQLRMFIRVTGSGRVVSAHPEDSTVGDRDVERCVRRVILSTRFPRTHGGGEAEVHYALSVDPPESVREPTTWSPERVARVVRRRGARARSACNAGSTIQVTAYVSRRGRVLRAGAASVEEADDETLDCIASRVRRWRMPSGRRISKVTFELT